MLAKNSLENARAIAHFGCVRREVMAEVFGQFILGRLGNMSVCDSDLHLLNGLNFICICEDLLISLSPKSLHRTKKRSIDIKIEYFTATENTNRRE